MTGLAADPATPSRSYNCAVDSVQYGSGHVFNVQRRLSLVSARAGDLWKLILVASLLLARLSGQSATYSEAEALVKNHQWDEGFALVITLLKSDPNNTRELNLAGLALAGKGDTDKANEYFRKCLRIDPRFVPALKNLGINEYNQSDISAAEKHLRSAAQQAPDDPVINLYLGEIAYRQKQYNQAAASLSRAPQFVSRSNNVAAHLAVSYLQIAEKQKALEILDRLSPEQIDDQAEFSLAMALGQADMPAKSAPFLAALQRRHPDSYDIGFDLTLVYTMANDDSAAIRTATELISHGHETAEL